MHNESDARVKVAFVCTHNSCRSQMAEAVARHFASNAFEVYSAGTHPKDSVNEGALRALEAQGISTQGLYSKTLEAIPPVDCVISMGCGVQCPIVACSYRDDWGLVDPTGGDDEAYAECIGIIKEKLVELQEKLQG